MGEIEKVIEKIKKNKKKIKEKGVKKIGIFGSFLKKRKTSKNHINILI